ALTIEDALTRSGTGDDVRVVVADSQTDFVPARMNKALGLRSLAADLAAGSSAEPSIALAVGDSVEDLPMLELAKLAVVPANAEAELRHRCEGTAIQRSNRPCQAGLLDAVSQLLGHDPRHCLRCRTSERPEPDDELLITILAA